MSKLTANASRLKVRHKFFCTDAAARVSGSNCSQSGHVIVSPYMDHALLFMFYLIFPKLRFYYVHVSGLNYYGNMALVGY